jgi:hypothetical protein
MKKIKIISVVAGVVILLLLNFSNINSNGKVEEMYVSVNPELASADEQCKLMEYFWVCHCRYGEIYCLLAHCPAGYLCDADIVVEE